MRAAFGRGSALRNGLHGWHGVAAELTTALAVRLHGRKGQEVAQVGEDSEMSDTMLLMLELK